MTDTPQEQLKADDTPDAIYLVGYGSHHGEVTWSTDPLDDDDISPIKYIRSRPAQQPASDLGEAIKEAIRLDDYFNGCDNICSMDPETGEYPCALGEEDCLCGLQAEAQERAIDRAKVALSPNEAQPDAVEGELPQDVIRLVVAARIVAFETQDRDAIKELDAASEAFASRVPWENEDER